MIDKAKRDELWGMLAEATALPWFNDVSVSNDGSVVMGNGLRIAHLKHTKNVKNHVADARLIAAAVNALPELLDALGNALALADAARSDGKKGGA